jgi:hypothetical protein
MPPRRGAPVKRAIGRFPRPIVGAAVLTAVVLLLSACTKPYQATVDEVAGPWCSADEDRLTLNPDGTFAINHLSLRFAEKLLRAEGFIDGYRIQRDYGGEAPTEASGTWTTEPDNNDPSEYHSGGVILQLKEVGTHAETDASTLYFDGDKNDWGFAVEHGTTFWRYFDRCNNQQVP